MLNKILGVMAFVDVAIVIAMPIAIILLTRRGKPLWKSYALFMFPYLIYGIGAGRGFYFTAYIIFFACMALESLHMIRCADDPWQVWAGAFVVLGVVPTALLFFGGMLRKGRSRA